MTERRLQWRYDTLDVPLDAAAAGGPDRRGHPQRRVPRRHHRRAPPLPRAPRHDGRAASASRCPSASAPSDDPEGGNQVTLMRFEVPVGIERPVGAMRRHRRALRSSCAPTGPSRIRTPSPASSTCCPITVTGGMLKHVDFLASNVPGFEADRVRGRRPCSRPSTRSARRSGRPPTSRSCRTREPATSASTPTPVPSRTRKRSPTASAKASTRCSRSPTHRPDQASRASARRGGCALTRDSAESRLEWVESLDVGSVGPSARPIEHPSWSTSRVAAPGTVDACGEVPRWSND